MSEFFSGDGGDPLLINTTVLDDDQVAGHGVYSAVPVPPTDAPVLDTNSDAIDFVDGGPPMVISANIDVDDADSANLVSVVVSITDNFEAGDLLIFANQLGITGSYNTGTGELTLTGTTTLANWQTALRTVEFQTLVSPPAASVREVSFVGYDGTNFSAPGIVLVTVHTVTPDIVEFFTPGADSWIVPAYAVLIVETWAGGAGGGIFASAGAHTVGNIGEESTVTTFGLDANPASVATNRYYTDRALNAIPGAPGAATGGDVNLPGQLGGYGGQESGGFSVPASPDQGGSAPYGGAGGSPHAGGAITYDGEDGTAPGGGGGAARLVDYSLLTDGYRTTHSEGGTSGSYSQKRFARGFTVGAPELGDTVNFDVGAGGASKNVTIGLVLITSGAGAPGGVRFTVLGPEYYTEDEGGPIDPTDAGTGTVSISAPDENAGTTLTAVYGGDDPDTSTGTATGLAYQWNRDGTPITGATGSTYLLTDSDIDSLITVTLTYTDGDGFFDTVDSDSVGPIEPEPCPLDYFINGEIFAAYGLRLLRTNYTGGPIIKLRSSNGTLLDFYPGDDRRLDFAAILAWGAANGGGAIKVAKWYNQMGNSALHLDGLLQTVTNAPDFTTGGLALYELPSGEPAIRFDGNEEFTIPGVAGPSTNLGFLACIARDADYPGNVFQWYFSGSQATDNAGFQLTNSAANDWQDNAAVFTGNGLTPGRSPRIVANVDEPASNTDDAVIWDGELNTTRNGLRRNGIKQDKFVDLHSTYTQPSATGSVLTVGPRPFSSGLTALIAELTLFGKDVRQTVGPYRANVANRYMIGFVGVGTTDDLTLDFEDDEGLTIETPSIDAVISAHFTDEDGLDLVLTFVPAYVISFTDEDGLAMEVDFTEVERQPASQLMVIAITTSS